MRNIDEVLDDHEKRLRRIELTLFEQGRKNFNFKEDGVPKGIQELIEEGYFNIPRTVKEIISELNKKGYFGTKQTIDSAIRRDFFRRRRIFKRIKEDNVWKYVISK